MDTPAKFATISVLLAVLLSSCSSVPDSKARAKVAMPTNPQVGGQQLGRSDLRRVRSGEFVKTYHLGRSVAGRNGETMHEAHRVYRLEKPGRWNLAREQRPLAAGGPVRRVVDPALQPAPESKAIRAELNRQREIAAELERTRGELVTTLEAMKARLQEEARSSSVTAALQKQVVRLRMENEALRRRDLSAGAPEASAPGGSADALREWGDRVGSEAADNPSGPQ